MRARTWIAIVAVAIILAVGFALKEYNRAPQGAAAMDAVLTVQATELHAAFMADEAVARLNYVGEQEQAIVVEGVIREMEQGDSGATVILETADPVAGVVCEFAAGTVPASWKPQARVRVQGICTGVNDLIPDVIMMRCGAVE
ncbi:MAG: hypothetical protein H6591_11215 [Flavobacteriales bacterium]|nr:hypothetical protein [Flavobacteriales bacterium]